MKARGQKGQAMAVGLTSDGQSELSEGVRRVAFGTWEEPCKCEREQSIEIQPIPTF